MNVTAEKQRELAGHTCPNYEPDFSGYCQECYRKAECMLQTALHKLESLKNRLGE